MGKVDFAALGLAVTRFCEVEPILDTLDFVEGLLCEGGSSVMFGPSNAGKTFIAMDIGLHVAANRSWWGKEVTGGPVVHFALEGGNAVKNRVAAWKKHKSIECEVPYYTVQGRVTLLDGLVQKLIDVIMLISKEAGQVKLVIIDTVNRALDGSDENSSQAMGELIKNVDLVRRETGAHLMLIHHSGKNLNNGARGHSSLLGSIDTEIEISKGVKKENEVKDTEKTSNDSANSTEKTDFDAILAIQCPDNPREIAVLKQKKQRDMAVGEDQSFALHVVRLGNNLRGKPVTSCVIEPAIPSPSVQIAKKETGQAVVALRVLKAVIDERGQPVPDGDGKGKRGVLMNDWRNAFYAAPEIHDNKAEAKRTAFRRAKDKLLETMKVKVEDTWVWIVGISGQTGQ